MDLDDDNDEIELVGPGIAPEVISYHDIDSQMDEFARKVALNERVLYRLQQYELLLLDATSLPALLDVLLYSTADHFSLAAVSLSLHDPDGVIAALLGANVDYGEQLSLPRTSFEMQQLYGAIPEVEVVSSKDPRAGPAASLPESTQAAVLLPLVRDGILVGSFHWSAPRPGSFGAEAEQDFINHLAAIIAICLENCINAERLSRLSLLDPLTRLSNERAYGLEFRKEISRAQRNQTPLSLLLIEIDGFKDIADNYGHLAGDFTLKTLARQIFLSLRSTDYLARVATAGFALILPGCPEMKAHEIAERIRSDSEFMEIDDGRGANLFASVSIGQVSWNPKNYPAVNMEQLATQMQNSARGGLQRAGVGVGNRVCMVRLTAMLV